MPSRIRPIVLTALLALVAAACGDDDAATTTTPADATTATSAASDTTTGTVAGGGEVTELLETAQSVPLRTTYRLFDDDRETTLILAQDPTANPPVESITVVEANTKIIIGGGTTILCDGSSGGCFEIPGGSEGLTESLLGPFSATLLQAGLPTGLAGVVDEGTTTVAGRPGTCFSFEPPPDPQADTDFVRQCIDSEFGFLLLLESSEVGTDEVVRVMELLEFTSPTPEDFEPTGPVTSTP